MREHRHPKKKSDHIRTKQRKRQKGANEQNHNFLNTLFRRIIISGLLLAALATVKNIHNPFTEKINSSLEYCIKYNMEYDWIVSNISKTAEYLISMLSNN